jgi:hypothetical protein
MEQPFLEHPTGAHETAVDAIEDTIRRFRALPESTRWLTLCAQGAGASDDTIHTAEVRIWKDKLDTGGFLNVLEITSVADVSGDLIVPDGAFYSIATATPEEAARLLDAIFRSHFKIRPFPGEQDYAVGAEWL